MLVYQRVASKTLGIITIHELANASSAPDPQTNPWNDAVVWGKDPFFGACLLRSIDELGYYSRIGYNMV
jgi:hypothetical protein